MCKKSHFVERNRLCFPSRVPLGWRETPRQCSALGSREKMELLSLGPPASQSCCWFRSGPIPSAGQAEHSSVSSTVAVHVWDSCARLWQRAGGRADSSLLDVSWSSKVGPTTRTRRRSLSGSPSQAGPLPAPPHASSGFFSPPIALGGSARTVCPMCPFL